jgi:hypothetical protein
MDAAKIKVSIKLSSEKSDEEEYFVVKQMIVDERT